MIVVADSSPLHYLILVEQVGLLRQLYSEVVIPEAVLAELTRGTLGVLRSAAEMSLIDVPDVLERLQATSFYVDDDLIESEFGRWLRK